MMTPSEFTGMASEENALQGSSLCFTVFTSATLQALTRNLFNPFLLMLVNSVAKVTNVDLLQHQAAVSGCSFSDE